MSIVTLGARGAALALVLVATLAAPAAAANPYEFSCHPDPTAHCSGNEFHTYDKQRAVAEFPDAYIASWFAHPVNGYAVNVIYGWGVAGGDYRTNTDLWLTPFMGNYSSYYDLMIDGTFWY